MNLKPELEVVSNTERKIGKCGFIITIHNSDHFLVTILSPNSVNSAIAIQGKFYFVQKGDTVSILRNFKEPVLPLLLLNKCSFALGYQIEVAIKNREVND